MSVRMREVAARAGVSTQTVSRVLREARDVSQPTVLRVRAAMEELGYLGNASAGALKRGKTHTFGLLLPLLSMPFWSEVAAGAELAAHARGYSVLLCDTSDSATKEASYLSLLLAHRVAGIVYVRPRCTPVQHPPCAALLASAIPLIVISSEVEDLPACHVRGDDERAGYVAVRHLLDLGRTRIALIVAAASPSEFPDGQQRPDDPLPAFAAARLAGARRALLEARLDADRCPVFISPDTHEGGLTVSRMLAEEALPRPDGVFVTTDVTALGLLEGCRARGLDVPGELAVVAHDGLPESATAVPSLTTVSPPRRAMGETCIDLLLQAGDGQPLPAERVIDAEFIVRESTVGAHPTARRGLSTPLSDSQAWSNWRVQQGSVPQSVAEVRRRMLGDLVRGGG